MGFNYSKERNKLEEKWKKLRIQYKEAGMDDESTELMYRYDLDVLNSERRYVNHTEGLTEKNSCSEDITTENISWIDSIEDEEILNALKKLSEEEIDILTLWVMRKYTQTEISVIKGVNKMQISRKIKKIKNIFQKHVTK